MAFKFVILAAALACANAGLLGAPVAYSAAPAVSSAYIQQSPVYAAAPVAYHTPSVGTSHQSVVRSPFGNQAVSQYSKAVDSAFSSVRKFDTRITNDAVFAHASPVVSSYAAHAPVIAAPAAIGYSPAAAVSHISFNGLGASYAF